MGALHSPLSRK